MITNITPDKHKSEALRKMADITLKRLEGTEMLKYPSNTLLDYYDIIHQLLEALTLREGIKVKGEGAHKELIDYVAKNHNLPEKELLFLQKMREHRNRIAYEGFSVHENFIKLNKATITGILGKLKNLFAK